MKEEITDLIEKNMINAKLDDLASVDPAAGYPDGYDGEVLSMIGMIYQADGELFSDRECLAMIHFLVNHWSEVVDL